MSEADQEAWANMKSPHEVEAERLARDYRAIDRGELVPKLGCALAQVDAGSKGERTPRRLH